MIDERCLGPDVDRSKLSPDAEIAGASYLTGPETSVGAGAVVRDSRLHNANIEAGAKVIDSICIAEGEPHTHECDSAGRVVVGGAAPRVGSQAEVCGCTLINVSVGAGSSLRDTWARDCRFGRDNTITDAKVILADTAGNVKIAGPTEVSEAYLGHYATIDRRGYFEGVFSNAFHRLRFNESAGRLEVTETIELPHLSRYGTNTINSTNSGKLLAQPDGVLKGFGPHLGLWRDELLSHEQIELGPCCWVAPWTKVVGQSPTPHDDDEDSVNDELMTYLMPFAVAGVGGDLTRGLVMPGELSVGLGPKARRGAWTFTYAPDAVIRMVARLHEALEADRKHLADTIVVESLQTAIEMTREMAHRNGMDLSIPTDSQRPGWPRWIATTYALLKAHLDGGLWRFQDGQPVGWRQENGRWTHPNIDCIVALAPDALEQQISEERILACEDPISPARIALRCGELAGGAAEPRIDPSAKIAPTATIGPGCRIGPNTEIGEDAFVWNSVLDNCTIGARTTVERSEIRNAQIGEQGVIRSCRIVDSTVGEKATGDAAQVHNAVLAARARITPFGDVRDVSTAFGAILGGAISDTKIDTHLMAMHMAGECRHLNALATPVRIDGREVLVPAMPMLGAGCRICGSEDSPVEMECCFIGSNAIVEAGTYVGFGCFILGTLGPNAGLVPFTVSTGGGAGRHQIGAVLGSLPSTIMTHFLSWTFQAVGPDQASAVGELVRQSVSRGLEAVEAELARRAGEDVSCATEILARYRSLREYSDGQLQSGLHAYRRTLDSGAWEIAWDREQLRFTSDKGCWLERSGSAFWKKK